jgi:pimeloyl-ACP methyl ester carboxylesterase
MRVLLLHAYPLDPAMWDAQRAALAGYEVRVPRLYDLPGDSLEEWAGALEPELGTAAVLVGASLGGYLALALALRAPERVRGVALVGSKASSDTPERRAGRDETLRELAERGAPPGAAATAIELARATRVLRNRPDQTETVHELAAPLLVCVGAADEIVPVAEAAALVASVPDGRLEVFEGAGHLLTEDDPERVTRLLVDFVGRCT